MRRFGVGLATLALGLATSLGAMAQVENRNQNQNRNDAPRNQRQNQNRNAQGEIKTIRGVIGAVAVEGETVVDYRTHRAVVAESTFLTVVGSESGRREARDRDGDNAARDRDSDRDQADRNAARNRDRNDRRDAGNEEAGNRDRDRHNVYVVLLTPRTEIRMAGAGAQRQSGERNASNESRANTANANANAANNMAADALEVGDRVEVRFRQQGSAGDNPDQINRKHGRHRTYFGEAMAITILAGPEREDRNQEQERGSDANRNRDNSDRNNADRNKEDARNKPDR